MQTRLLFSAMSFFIHWLIKQLIQITFACMQYAKWRCLSIINESIELEVEMCLNWFEWQVSLICFCKTICSLSIILSSLASSFAFSYSFSAMVKKLASVLWLISLFNSKQNIVKQNMTDVESNIWLTFLSHVKFDVVNMFHFLKLLNQFHFEMEHLLQKDSNKNAQLGFVISKCWAYVLPICDLTPVLKSNLTQLANFGENTSQSFTAVPLRSNSSQMSSFNF